MSSGCNHDWVDYYEPDQLPSENDQYYTAATCIEPGSMHITCSICGATDVRTIAPLGHDYVVVTPAYEHPDCSQSSWTATKECSRCGNVIAGSTYLNHQWSEWETIVPATCVENGYKERHCACGKTQRMIISALGHDVDENTVTERKDPTCTEDGYIIGTCSRCGAENIKEILRKLGHNFTGEYIYIEPTCLEDGWQQGYCDRCEKWIEGVISATGHYYGDFDQYGHICTNDSCGDYQLHTLETNDQYKYCTGCRYKCFIGLESGELTLDDYSDDIKNYFNNDLNAMKDHILEHGEVLMNRIDKNFDGAAHAYWDVELLVDMIVGGESIDSTKAEPGVHYDPEIGWEVKLTVPEGYDAQIYDLYVFHMFTDGEYAVELVDSEVVEGEVCFVLKSFSPVVVSMICKEHAYTGTVKQPDCVNGGYTTYVCDNCGHTYVGDETVALGHTYVSVVTDPTCTEKGYTTHTCSCGDSYIDSYVDELGHDLIHHDGQNPTCTEKGWKEYDTCRRCDYTTYEGIAATGHNFAGDWHYDDNGHWHNCDVCGLAGEVAAHNHVWTTVDELTDRAICECGHVSDERNYVCWNPRTQTKYEIVHLAIMGAEAGDTIEMLTNSDETVKTDLFDYAADINLIGGVTLDLKGYTLKVNSLFAAEGSYLIGNTPKVADLNDDNAGKLIVPAENLILEDAVATLNAFRGDGYLPVWDEAKGYYVICRVQILNDDPDNDDDDDRVLTVDTTTNELRFQFDLNASKYILDNLFANSGVTDNRMSVEVYLEWKVNGTGTAHQTFVFTDEMVGNAAWTMNNPNPAAEETDLYFTLTNFDELGIDLNTLTITARISSDCGAMVEGTTWAWDAENEVAVLVENDDDVVVDDEKVYEFDSATGYVCYNERLNKYYEVVHDAIFEAIEGDTIVMIANSDQRLLKETHPGAAMVNLKSGVTLNLKGYTLALDCIIVNEGSYLVATETGVNDTDDNNAGKLVVPAENFIMLGVDKDVTNDRGDGHVPVWNAENGYYLFSRVQILNNDPNPNEDGDERVLTVDAENETLKLVFDVNASKYILNNLFANSGVTDNRMAVEVYLEWQVEGSGTAHQTFVFTDEMVGKATHTIANGASEETDLYFALSNYTELGIDISTLTITARIVSNSGTSVEGVCFYGE